RRVVTERLSGRRRRGHDHVLPCQRVLDGYSLMGIELGDAPSMERVLEPLVEGRGKRHDLRHHGHLPTYGGDSKFRRVGPVWSVPRDKTLEDRVERTVTSRRRYETDACRYLCVPHGSVIVPARRGAIK